MTDWLATLMTLTLGLALILFGLLARVHGCQKNLEQAFFGAGYVVLFVSCMMFCAALLSIILAWRRRKASAAIRR